MLARTRLTILVSAGFVSAGMVALSGAACRAQDTFADAFWQFQLTSGFDYSSGKYGAAKPTEVLYVPVSLRASKGPWSLKVTSGWLSVTGPALLVDAGSGEAAGGLRTSGRANGVADVNLWATYSVESLYDDNLFVDLSVRVKAPAASFKKGLGTGEWDAGAQIDVASAFGGFMPFAQVGYRITNSPAGFDLRDIVYGSVGAQYTWNERVTAGVSYEIRQASIATAKMPQEGSVYLSTRLGENWTMTAYGVAGFSPNSPSGGGGLSLSYRWL